MKAALLTIFGLLISSSAFADAKLVAICGDYDLSQDLRGADTSTEDSYFSGIAHYKYALYEISKEGSTEFFEAHIEPHSEGATLTATVKEDGVEKKMEIVSYGQDFYMNITDAKGDKSKVTCESMD